MVPVHFTVSQIRSAAACPRILYFDCAHSRAHGLPQPATSRIWKPGQDDETTACGALFHAAIEQFNGKAATEGAWSPERLEQEIRLQSGRVVE